MQWVMAPYPPGYVGFPGGETARFVEFYDCRELLLAPEGTLAKPFRSYDVAMNYNNLCQTALDEGAAWVWILNDDNVFHPDLLLKLLARDVDVITPLVAVKNPPFCPMVYREPVASDPFPVPYTVFWGDVPATGLRTSLRFGCNGLLIRRKVLEAIEQPWFRYGQFGSAGIAQEDVYFASKVIDAGFKIYVDCDNRMGHLTYATVWPAPPTGVEIELGGPLEGMRQQIVLPGPSA